MGAAGGADQFCAVHEPAIELPAALGAGAAAGNQGCGGALGTPPGTKLAEASAGGIATPEPLPAPRVDIWGKHAARGWGVSAGRAEPLTPVDDPAPQG